ncbi:MAG: multiheme c-type cytochrome, partial [Myxococcota bacterium]
SLLCVVVLGAAALTGCSSSDDMPDLLEPRDETTLVFGDPEDCRECHPQHVAEWEISNHAYALVDPVFQAMVELGQWQTEGKLDDFCMQCHSPTGMANGQTEVYFDEDLQRFRQNIPVDDPIAKRGVSCDVCHSMTAVVEPVNARAVYTPDGVRRATIKDPVATPAHDSAYSELHETSDMCGSCHQVLNPRGALVEETFTEWAQSSAAAEGKTCQSCHMPAYEGKAAEEGPTRTVHRHTFVGVDVSLLAEDEFPGYYEMREMTTELLRGAVEFDATADPDNRRIDLRIRNLAGHSVPSGATAERQMWVELIIRDDSGAIVFESGTLDENNDIRTGVADHTVVPGSDPQLVYYGQQLIAIPGLEEMDDADKEQARDIADANCLPMGLGSITVESGIIPVSFPWQANWQCNYMIPPDGIDEPGYDLSDLAPGSYTATVKLQFRTFPPYFLRKLEAEVNLDPAVKERLPTVLMAETELVFSLQ